MSASAIEQRLADVLGCELADIGPVADRCLPAVKLLYEILNLETYDSALAERLLPRSDRPSDDLLDFAQKIADAWSNMADLNPIMADLNPIIDWAQEILEKGGVA